MAKSKKKTEKLTLDTIGGAITKAKEKAKGKEGADLRTAKKSVKRLQRTKRRMAAEKKRLEKPAAKA